MASRLSVLLVFALLGAAPPSQSQPSQLIAAARARLDANDFAGAVTYSGRALALAPRDPAVLLLAGNLVRDRYGMAAALPWYDRVLEVRPSAIPALIDKAATLGDMGQSVAMLGLTRQILALDPKQPIALYLQAVLAARAGKWEVARGLLYRTGGRIDNSPAVMILRGAASIETGANETAIAALNPLVAMQPGNRYARRLLALALWRSDDDQGALDMLAPIADDGDAWVLTVMARAAETVGDRTRAASLLDRAANASVQHARWQGGGAGDDLMAAGQWQAAAAAYTQSANARFTEPTAFRLIDALNRSGQDDKAGVVLATLVVQHPASLPALRLAASDALGRREWGRAATALGAIRNRVGDTDALMLGNLGWARFNLGQRAEAVALARRAYAISPASDLAAANYGWFLSDTGKKAAGIALLQKAVATNPGYAPYRAKLAEAQRR
ncbi:hypothetical protein BH09PSE3_BH09PSE3_18990 [soil metagenome]